MDSKTKTTSICFFISMTFLFINSNAQNMTTPALSTYESQVKKFKPEQSLAARNYNDVRAFVYEWFTHFEHASTVDYYLNHLDAKNLNVSFPGQSALTSHSDFTTWYNNLLSQTLWNFHDLSKVQVKRTTAHKYLITFVVDWYGEVKASSEQLAGWQSRKDSNLYHYTLRQTWEVQDIDNKLTIHKLSVTSGDTPSPIAD